MKILRLAAVLVALAGPAWAYNDGVKPDAVQVCREVSENYDDICLMKHASEEEALAIARRSLTFCPILAVQYPEEVEVNRQCSRERAYIKQRWGY
jgi:hypothetical protein